MQVPDHEDNFLWMPGSMAKNIYLNDPNQEQLYRGLNLTSESANLGSTQIWAPVQMVTHHIRRSDQLSLFAPVQTLFQQCTGDRSQAPVRQLATGNRLNGYYVYYNRYHAIRPAISGRLRGLHQCNAFNKIRPRRDGNYGTDMNSLRLKEQDLPFGFRF